MNKTITLYELIELIRYGKAPKKIKVTGHTYEFDEDLDMYLTQEESCRTVLGGVTGEINLIANIFNEIVEILPEENDEWEDIEEINFLDGFNDSYYDTCLIKMGDICNQLIKNQKYLKGRLIEKNEK